MSRSTPRVAVVAHARKTLGPGLPALREALTAHGVDDPIWHEFAKGKLAPQAVDAARRDGAELYLVWGGDGTVQRAIDALVGRDATIGILPAGTANQLAVTLGVPVDLDGAVDVALHGADRRIDVGRLNGEHFALMAGTGLDALLIRDADRGLKDRFGRIAYLWTGLRNLRAEAVETAIEIDGVTWFDGPASCVLIGNVGEITGGITAFEAARLDDGRLDIGVVTAEGPVQWGRTLARAAFGDPARSPLVQISSGERIVVRQRRKRVYEIDGGDRPATKRLKIRAVPGAITIRVPTSVT